MSIYSSSGMIAPNSPYLSRLLSEKPAVKTKSVSLFGSDIFRDILSAHWSLGMAVQSICTLVCSSRRLKIVLLLGSDSVLGG